MVITEGSERPPKPLPRCLLMFDQGYFRVLFLFPWLFCLMKLNVWCTSTNIVKNVQSILKR